MGAAPRSLGPFWDDLKAKPAPSGATPDVNDAARGDPELLRTGIVRYLGYANEVGESFRPLISRTAVNASYGVAGMYVAADAVWRGGLPPPGRSSFVEACDTLLWQGLASVAVPGFVINRIVWAVGRAGPPQYQLAPTAAGMASIRSSSDPSITL